MEVDESENVPERLIHFLGLGAVFARLEEMSRFGLGKALQSRRVILRLRQG